MSVKDFSLQNLLSDPTGSIVAIWVNFFQTELMVEIYSKSPVRAIGKVLLMKFTPIKTHKGDKECQCL